MHMMSILDILNKILEYPKSLADYWTRIKQDIKVMIVILDKCNMPSLKCIIDMTILSYNKYMYTINI